MKNKRKRRKGDGDRSMIEEYERGSARNLHIKFTY